MYNSNYILNKLYVNYENNAIIFLLKLYIKGIGTIRD